MFPIEGPTLGLLPNFKTHPNIASGWYVYIYIAITNYIHYIYISQRHTGYSKQHGYIDPYKVMPPRFSDGRKKPHLIAVVYHHRAKHHLVPVQIRCLVVTFIQSLVAKFHYHDICTYPILVGLFQLHPILFHYIPWHPHITSHGCIDSPLMAISASRSRQVLHGHGL